MQEESAQNRHLRGQVELLETQLHSAGLQPADEEALDEPQVGCCSPCPVLACVCRLFLCVPSFQQLVEKEEKLKQCVQPWVNVYSTGSLLLC